MRALLQSCAGLCFAPRLQEACALDAFTNTAAEIGGD